MIPRSPKPGVSSTWVNSQWKFLPLPGHFSAEINSLGPSELRKMRQLEEENQKLKRLVADLSLDKAMLQEVLAKKA